MKNKNLQSLLLIFLCIISSQAQFPARGPQIKSPEILKDNSVILRLNAPEANSVKLAGSVLDDYTPLEMQKNEAGIFEIKIGPLSSDMYVYTFRVDGVTALDPNNPVTIRDGSHIESRLVIDGEVANHYNAFDINHGKVTSVWYDSKTVDAKRRMLVYSPPGYETSKKEYPVLYLLHGGGGDEEAWISRGRANYILDNLINEHKALPMIVVMTNGSINTESAPDQRPFESFKKPAEQNLIALMSNGVFEKSLFEDVVPFIEENFRVKKDSKYRAIAGLSMGGLHTLNTFMAHPDQFRYINVMSSGWFQNNKAMFENGDKRLAEIASTLNHNVKLLRFTQGGPKDIAYENGLAMLKVFDKHGINYEFSEMPGGHSWNVWRKDLYYFVQQLFK